jgi:preprotein translocase subunit SecE
MAGAATIPWRKARSSFADPQEAIARTSMAKTTPGEFIRQVRAEASKVVWPTRQETVRTAIFVGLMLVILSVFFLGVDSLFGEVVRWLLKLAS